MPSILDAAKYILEKQGSLSALKLQKLTYYTHAWCLAWTDEALFPEEFQAWRNGPVNPDLYQRYRDEYPVTSTMVPGDSATLSEDQQDTIDHVLKAYGDKSPQWLSDLTHAEDPWRNACDRAHPQAGEHCDEVIAKTEMLEYYASL